MRTVGAAGSWLNSLSSFLAINNRAGLDFLSQVGKEMDVDSLDLGFSFTRCPAVAAALTHQQINS
jgi:hypothetical protein